MILDNPVSKLNPDYYFIMSAVTSPSSKSQNPLGAIAAATVAAAESKPEFAQIVLAPQNKPVTRFLWVLLLLASAGLMLYLMGWPAVRATLLGETLPPLSTPSAVFLICLCVFGIVVKMRIAVSVLRTGRL